MSLFRAVRSGLRRLTQPDVVGRELDDEVRQFIDAATEENMRAGMTRADAERAARLAFGGVETAKEQVRAGGWESSIETLLRDLRHALRGLRRTPAFTAIVVVTLALGIGANAAMFSIVNAVILRALPYHDAGRLALIYTDDVRRGLHQEPTAFLTITDWRAESRAFQDLAFYSAGRATLVDASGARERSRSAFVSSNLFTVLGVAPLRGRTLAQEDEDRRAPVAVISYGLWQRRFSGSDDVIGKALPVEDAGKFGGGALTIVGVMPRGFYFPDKQTEFWTPATTYWRFARESSERFPPWARRWIGIGRVAPGTSLAEARSDLARIGSRLATTYPSSEPDFPGFATSMVPILDQVTGPGLQASLWILLGAVGLVLLIACANVAHLLLARGAARQREFVIRAALGAGRGRLIRQLLAESAVLAFAGGVLGTALAVWSTRLLAVAAASRIPRIDELSVDVRVLAFAAIVSLLAGAVFGVLPAFRVTHAGAGEALRQGSQSSGGIRIRRSRDLLVLAECAVAMTLLAGAGLLLSSLARVQRVDPGFDPRGVLTVRIYFPAESPVTPQESAQNPVTVDVARARARRQQLAELEARVQSLPGVSAVGFMDDLFNTGSGSASISLPGRAVDSLAAGELEEGQATAGFFGAMRVPLRRGRYLADSDTDDKIRALWAPPRTVPPVLEPVVVNETFARRFFPGEDPVGKRFCIDPTNRPYWYVIVGVVGDMHRQGLERATIAEYFAPYLPSADGRADLVVRLNGDPLLMAPTVRRVIGEVIPGTLITGISTADAQLAGFSAQRRFQTALLAGFALLALCLAAIGIYGVVHYSVTERVKEIGVRIALGAAPADVVALVVGHGMRMPVLGIGLGLAASLGVSRVMTHLLFGITATDPVTFGAVGLVLVFIALVACYAPARRAARIDPVRALRDE